MQTIENGIIFYRLSAEEVITYLNSINFDYNKHVKVIDNILDPEYMSIVFICNDVPNGKNLLRCFIDEGANVNITSEDKYKSFFSDILHPYNVELLKISLPYFNLKKNSNLMWNVHHWLKYEDLEDDFKEILEELISKFNQKTWKRNLRRFITEKHYTATTASDFFDSYPMLY